jgi:hypothetical protein
MKNAILILLGLFYLQGLQAAPPKAKGIADAKYVLCDNKDYEFYLNFKNSKLKPGKFGEPSGTLGVIEYGIRKKGDAFTKAEDKYPTLSVNGPSASISVYESKQQLKALAKTYDFRSGTGELKSDSISPQKVDCIYYVDAVY